MDTLSYKTANANRETVNKEWLLIDAEGMVLGRLASEVAKLLRGKRTAREILVRFPERLVEHAVKGMLPKNRLGSDLFRNLYVYVGPEHKQEAQQPKEFKIKTNK
jgi:large subunit ribosomal protein L13